MIGRHSHDAAQAFDDAWNARTSSDREIAELVRLAESLCEAAVAAPSAQFRSDLRTRLMTEAATTLVPMPGSARPAAPSQASHPVRRRLAAFATVAIAATGAVGLVSTSASALPGDLLYPVKRSVESVELTLQRSDSGRGTVQLEQASERLDEARQLSDQDASATLVSEALDSFVTAAADGSTKLFDDFTDNGDEQSVRAVAEFVEASSTGLAKLSDQLPRSAGDAYAAAAETVGSLAAEASSLCVTCTSPQVRALVGRVSTEAKKDSPRKSAGSTEPVVRPTPRVTQRDEPSTAVSPQPAPTPAAPTAKPAAPVPTVPTRTPSLRDLTDPVVGGLLGDEDQEGLVPGLLNGLLGKNK